MTGRVRSLPEGKQFGFIKGDGDKDYFFHKDDFEGNWREMNHDFRMGHTIEVEFEPAEGMKGLRAGNVVRI